MKLYSIFFFSSLLLFTSCTSYMNTIYKDFEQQERANSDVDVAGDSFDQYRHPERKTSTEYNRLDRTVTTANEKSLAPTVKRQYKPEKETAKRYTASDLTDNGNDGSLWSGTDPNAFLFSNNKSKNAGDIVQIAVLARLKNEITMEPQIIRKQPKGNDFPLSFAFICFAVEIVIPLECSQSSGNKKFTAEAKFQEERERSVLSVTYYNILHVPFSPAEPIDNSQTLVPDGIIPVIPLYEIQQQPSTNQLPVISFDSTALTSLLHNPDLLKVLSSFKNK